MASFLDDETDTLQVFGTKRNYDDLHVKRREQYFGRTRHNLLEDFDETPTKVMKPSKGCDRVSICSQSSESFKTPESALVENLKKEITEFKANIVTYKANIVKLENTVANVETAARENQIRNDKEMAKIKTVNEREMAKSAEIHSKLQYIMGMEREARKELVTMEKGHNQQKLQMEKKILEIQREKLEECDRAQQAQAKWMEKEMSLHREIISQESDIKSWKMKYEESEALLALRKRLQEENSDQNDQLQDLVEQLKEEKQKNKELSQQIADHEDAMVTTKALKADLDMVPSMKRELEKLQMDNDQLKHNEQNTLLLEEEVRSLKSKLVVAETKCEKLIELEVANEDLEGRLHRWEAADTSGSRRPQSPSSLSRRISELETSQAMMLMKRGEVETELNRTKLKLEQIESKSSQTSVELSSERTTVTQQNDLIKRLKRKLLLVTKERESYKGILDSYESEATINVDAQKQARISQLEEIVQGYHNQSAEMESEMNSMAEKLASSQAHYEKALHQLQNMPASDKSQSSNHDNDAMRQLKEKVAALENTLLKTQEDKDILEARIEQRQLQGDYDPSKIKVLHLLRNPCSIAQQERKEMLDKLTAENDKLRKRNELLEETGGRVEDLTMQVDEKLQQPSPTKELQEMKTKLKREETRNQRLTEVFKKTSQEFREICYQLTGYKIDIPHTNQYRLTNMYAASPNEHLWFKQNEQGQIQLLETDFSYTLKDAMELYLQQQNSIPLFLSSVTMDLFSKQTLNITS